MLASQRCYREELCKEETRKSRIVRIQADGIRHEAHMSMTAHVPKLEQRINIAASSDLYEMILQDPQVRLVLCSIIYV